MAPVNRLAGILLGGARNGPEPGIRMKRFVWTTLVFAASWRALAQTDAFPAFDVRTARDYLARVSSEFLEQVNTNAEATFIVARLESELGRKDRAEQLAKLSLSLDPNRAEVHQFLASLFIRKDQLEDAAVELRNAVRIDPTITPGYSQLGMVLDRLGERNAARRAFEEAVHSSPKQATSRLLLGGLLLDEGELDEAITQLEEACRLDPLSPNPCYALFQARQKHGDKEAAEQVLRHFQELKQREETATDVHNAATDNSNDVRAVTASFHVAAAVLLGRQGKQASAEKHLVQATRVAPAETKAYELLAQMYLTEGRSSDARSAMETLTRLSPKQPAYGVNLATLLLRLKQGPEAIAEFNRVLAINPDEPAALNNLARYFLGTRRNLPDALLLCRRLVSAEPKGANYDLRGWALYSNGRTNEAVAACKEAVRLDPRNETLQAHFNRIRQIGGTNP